MFALSTVHDHPTIQAVCTHASLSLCSSKRILSCMVASLTCFSFLPCILFSLFSTLFFCYNLILWTLTLLTRWAQRCYLSYFLLERPRAFFSLLLDCWSMWGQVSVLCASSVNRKRVGKDQGLCIYSSSFTLLRPRAN